MRLLCPHHVSFAHLALRVRCSPPPRPRCRQVVLLRAGYSAYSHELATPGVKVGLLSRAHMRPGEEGGDLLLRRRHALLLLASCRNIPSPTPLPLTPFAPPLQLLQPVTVDPCELSTLCLLIFFATVFRGGCTRGGAAQEAGARCAAARLAQCRVPPALCRGCAGATPPSRLAHPAVCQLLPYAEKPVMPAADDHLAGSHLDGRGL